MFGKVQLAQTGRDAISFQNSADNQVTINNIILQLFGQPTTSSVDWAWAKKLLEQKQLPDIRKRLTDTLGRDRYQIAIALKERLSWVGRSPLEAERRLQVQGEDRGILDMRQLLIETFGQDDIAGKLLILGTPGAGKTTTLLSLAEQLVLGAIAQPKTVIPVLFELSTWRDDQRSIQDWLIEQLYDLHGGDRKAKRYEQWLQQQVVLPLLDGLDELDLERQQKCTLKLNEFARQYPQLVVCCRVKEFAQVNIKFNHLNGAVCLEPLSNPQIQAYLETIQRSQLWSAIQSTPALQNLLKADAQGDPGLLRVPLFLALAARAYDPQHPFQTKAELLTQYVDRQLSPEVRQRDRRKAVERRDWAFKTLATEPDWRRTQRTLRWLARQLQQNNRVELLIEQIQPTWLETQRSQEHYRLMGGLSVGLIVWLILGLMGGLSVGLSVGLILGLILGVSVGLIFTLDTIPPVEAFEISMPLDVRRGALARLTQWLIFCLLYFGLMGGLIVGLIVGLIGGLIGELIGGLKQGLQLRSRPNQGIWNSLQGLLWTTALSYPLAIIFIMAIVVRRVAEKHGWLDLAWLDLAGIFLRDSPQFLLLGLLISLFCGFLEGSGVACVQHVCLRFVLWQSGVAPWNLARFLNYCVERRLLQRVGGRYRFLHRELLDYFASQPPTV